MFTRKKQTSARRGVPIVLGVMLSLALLLSACAPAATPTAAPTTPPTAAPAVTEAPAATATTAPTETSAPVATTAPATAAPTEAAAPTQAATSGAAGATPVPPQVEVVTAAAGAPTLTANDNINVRSGPGTNYPSYGVAPKGSSAEAIGKNSDGTWWLIKVNPNTIPAGVAWVSADFVTATNAENVPVVAAPPPPTMITLVQPGAGVTIGTTTEPVNVRSGPGNDYDSYGTIPVGTSFEIAGISQDQKWYEIKIPTTLVASGVGWVNASYVVVSQAAGAPTLTTVPAPPLPPQIQLKADTGKPFVIAMEAVNVRSGPGTSYAIYGVAPAGTQGNVVGLSQDKLWYAVTVPTWLAANGVGWVDAHYVVGFNISNVPVAPAPAPATPVAVPTPATSGVVGTTTEPINVRSGPGNQYPSYGTIPSGTSLQLTGKNQDGSWLVLAIPTNLVASGQGWVSAAYVSYPSGATLPVVPAPPTPTP